VGQSLAFGGQGAFHLGHRLELALGFSQRLLQAQVLGVGSAQATITVGVDAEQSLLQRFALTGEVGVEFDPGVELAQEGAGQRQFLRRKPVSAREQFGDQSSRLDGVAAGAACRAQCECITEAVCGGRRLLQVRSRPVECPVLAGASWSSVAR
jgi:hypothetical protein